MTELSSDEGLALADDSGGVWANYAPTWLGGNRNSKVQVISGDGQGSLVYKDVNGQQHAGKIITSRSDLDTGVKHYDYRYTDASGRAMVRQVDQNGFQTGQPQTFQSYVDKQQAAIERSSYRYGAGGGATQSAIPSQAVPTVSGRGGETTGDLAAEMFKNYGVQVGNAALQAQSTNSGKAATVGLVSLQLAANYEANGVSMGPDAMKNRAAEVGSFITDSQSRNETLNRMSQSSAADRARYFVPAAQVGLYQAGSKLDAMGVKRAQQGATIGAEALNVGKNYMAASEEQDPYLRQLRQTLAVADIPARAAGEIVTNPLAISPNATLRNWQPVASEAVKQTVMMPINQTANLSEALIINSQAQVAGGELNSRAEVSREAALAQEALRNSATLARQAGDPIQIPSGVSTRDAEAQSQAQNAGASSPSAANSNSTPQVQQPVAKPADSGDGSVGP